jgi:hypothetical protein
VGPLPLFRPGTARRLRDHGPLRSPRRHAADRPHRRLAGRWGGNHTPRHWTLYDERTLRDLAERVGLALERVEFQPNPIFWVWSCHASARERFPGSRWPDRLFPPVEIFSSSARSLVLLSGFTVLDLLLRAISGRTASIGVELRKPSA